MKTLALACAAALALAACGTAHEDAPSATDPGAAAGTGGAGGSGAVGGSGGAGGTTLVDGAALYASDCAGCHGDLATSSKRGATAAQITAAISANMGGMATFGALTADQLAALETALAAAPAGACTYTYSAWGACQPDGTQGRTVTGATPAGCTGTPALTQACSYVPPPVGTCTSFTYGAWAPATCPSSGQQTRTVVSASPAGCTGGSPVLAQACTPPLDGAALYAASCAGCHGALASSNLKGKNISVSLIKSKGMTQGLTDAQLQAIVTAVGP